MSLLSILAVSGGSIWPNSLALVQHYTTLQHYSFFVWNSSVSQTWLRLCLTVACNILHISPIWCLKWAHLRISSMTCTDLFCNLSTPGNYLFALLAFWECCKLTFLKYFQIWGTIWEICDKDCHLLFSPCVDLLYRACISLLLIVADPFNLGMVVEFCRGERTLQDLPHVQSLMAPREWFNISSSDGETGLDPCAELLVVLGILGLCDQ